jgi:hypothetical protein
MITAIPEELDERLLCKRAKFNTWKHAFLMVKSLKFIYVGFCDRFVDRKA